MTFQLRQYQSEAVESAVGFLLDGSSKNGLIVLPTGCLAGDTEVFTNRAGNGHRMTLATIFRAQAVYANRRKPGVINYTRSFDGTRIGLHEFESVVYSGRRKTLHLRLENGLTLRATPEHKILTEAGWMALSDLGIGVRVICDTPRPVADPAHRKAAKAQYRQVQGLIFHAYACHCNAYRSGSDRKPEGRLFRVPFHRLVAEAELNGISVERLIEICRRERGAAADLTLLDPEEFAVHHRDENPKNNDPRNLQVLTHAAHLALHGDISHFRQGMPQAIRVAEVARFGTEDVYDLLAVKPHENFVANGMVVHNSGKSLVLANIAQRLDAPVLIFQPSKEILEQNLDKFKSYGYSPGVYSASMNRRSVGEITLATIGSVAGAKGEKVQRGSKAHLFADFPYIIVDECHEVNSKTGGYKSFFDEVPAKLLGLTATPFRMASNSYGTEMRWLTRTKPRIFHDVIYYANIRDLMDEGYLVKPEYQIVRGFNRHKVQANAKGSDYTDSSVQKHLFEIGFDERLEEVMRRLIHKVGRQHILVFTRFVQDAENLVKAVDGGASVSDKTPKREREAILRDFKSGSLKYVANCKILDTGFDFPELDTVVDAGPTMSLRRHMQKLGRLVRPAAGKADAWLVDMVCGIERFGKIEDLKIHEDPWCIRSGDRQLTNAYLTDKGKQKCDRCGSSLWFWARHSETNNAQRISRPTNGVLPNIKIRRVGGKTLYDIVEPGRGEFLVHAAICPGRVRR